MEGGEDKVVRLGGHGAILYIDSHGTRCLLLVSCPSYSFSSTELELLVPVHGIVTRKHSKNTRNMNLCASGTRMSISIKAVGSSVRYYGSPSNRDAYSPLLISFRSWLSQRFSGQDSWRQSPCQTRLYPTSHGGLRRGGLPTRGSSPISVSRVMRGFAVDQPVPPTLTVAGVRWDCRADPELPEARRTASTAEPSGA